MLATAVLADSAHCLILLHGLEGLCPWQLLLMLKGLECNSWPCLSQSCSCGLSQAVHLQWAMPAFVHY
jgi:hypothetical protein